MTQRLILQKSVGGVTRYYLSQNRGGETWNFSRNRGSKTRNFSQNSSVKTWNFSQNRGGETWNFSQKWCYIIEKSVSLQLENQPIRPTHPTRSATPLFSATAGRSPAVTASPICPYTTACSCSATTVMPIPYPPHPRATQD